METRLNTKVLTATNHNYRWQRDEPIRILSNYLNRSQSAGDIAIGRTRFCYSLVENWRDIFGPITKRSNRNRAITFDNHLKTALLKGTINMPACAIPLCFE